jgi:hypothetical protein
MKLLRTFPKDAFEFGLASWQWLGLREQTPRFATCFGDIFLESLDGWWFLDTVEGTLELRWTSAVTMYEELESPEGRATYLMDDLVRDARRHGIHLGEDDVYVFDPHPALGGELSVDNLGAMPFELAVRWVGQMHDRLLHSSGEIQLPPMPDGGRRATTPPVATAWDSAWSDDETFAVPFEQYLATTTFAAVSSPARHDADHPSLPPVPSHGHDDSGRVPYAAQGYSSHGYATPAPEAPVSPARPDAVATWAPREESAPWSGQTEAAPAWSEPDPAPRTAAPPERHDDPYGLSYPAVAQAAASEPHAWNAPEPAGRPHVQQSWAPYGAGQDGSRQAPAANAGPVWDRPHWGSTGWDGTGWGAQAAPAVAAGSHQQSTDDPFTAWDDLWGKH